MTSRYPLLTSKAVNDKVLREQAELERFLVELILSAFPFERSANKLRIETDQWPVLTELAANHGLSPLVYASIARLRQLDMVPADTIHRLHGAYLRTKIANSLAFEHLADLLDVFEREQIAVVLLKGCALAPFFYPDVALRPMGDLDLLIPRSSVAHVHSLLVGHGFETTLGVAEGFQRRFHNEQTFYRTGSRAVQIDLHWNLVDVPYVCERIDIEWFWQRVVEVRVNGRFARAFSLEAQVLHLCAHLAYHHREARRLIWSYDLALLLAQQGEQLNWEELLERAEGFGLLHAVEENITIASEWWGVRCPAAMSGRIRHSRLSMAEHLLLVVATARDPGVAMLVRAFSVPGLQGKLEFCLRNVFPTPAYMQRRYGISGARLALLHYPSRIARGLHKLIRFGISIVIRAKLADKYR